MNFEKVLKLIITTFNEKKVNYSLIGGYALGFLGVSRNTFDIDFLLDKKDKNIVKEILNKSSYNCIFETDNVAQYISEFKELGEIDIIYSFREPSQKMLKTSKTFNIFNDSLTVKVLNPEDIIALKLQAIKNDKSRYNNDMQDIKDLIKIHKNNLDKEKLVLYFETFNYLDLYKELFNEENNE